MSFNNFIEPERQLRRKGDPAPCLDKRCNGGRCRECSGWGTVGRLDKTGEHTTVEGVHHMGMYVSEACSHGCPQPARYYAV
jgi:hypothetical protein